MTLQGFYEPVTGPCGTSVTLQFRQDEGVLRPSVRYAGRDPFSHYYNAGIPPTAFTMGHHAGLLRLPVVFPHTFTRRTRVSRGPNHSYFSRSERH